MNLTDREDRLRECMLLWDPAKDKRTVKLAVFARGSTLVWTECVVEMTVEEAAGLFISLGRALGDTEDPVGDDDE